MLEGYNVFNAIWDFLKGDLKKATKDVAATRQSICDTCEMRSETFKICTICGCVISAKVRLEKSSCPMELW